MACALPSFIRRGEETYDRISEVPEQLRARVLAVRPSLTRRRGLWHGFYEDFV